ncbi:MAG: hypothetical protein HYR94_09770 [Chloroflexi bacterium]|nr:hypothetical protein [Chloroflexota bacterium]
MSGPRKRATALVEPPHGILLALEGNVSDLFLPGGGVEEGETELDPPRRRILTNVEEDSDPRSGEE